MIADVTVVTPCIPERFGMLNQCIASVDAQLVKPKRHVIGIDYERVGCAALMNDLVAAVDTEWIVPLADDDLLMKHFVGEMVAHAGTAAVTYSRPVAVGADWAPRRYEFSAPELRKENYIPSTALIRTDLWRKIGGYRTREDPSEHDFWSKWRASHNFNDDMFPDDWDFWLRALDSGAFFRHVPSRNWVYRFHTDNLFNQPRLRRTGARPSEPPPEPPVAAPTARG